jgi:hypothetical protein
MLGKITLLALVLSLGLTGTASAMPNDWETENPIETLEAYIPSTGQMWREITISLYACDGRYNPDCEWGKRLGMLQIEYQVSIDKVDSVTGELSNVESYAEQTHKNGFSAIPVLLDEKYEDNTEYVITVTTADDTESGSFWTHTRNY